MPLITFSNSYLIPRSIQLLMGVVVCLHQFPALLQNRRLLNVSVLLLHVSLDVFGGLGIQIKSHSVRRNVLAHMSFVCSEDVL